MSDEFHSVFEAAIRAGDFEYLSGWLQNNTLNMLVDLPSVFTHTSPTAGDFDYKSRRICHRLLDTLQGLKDIECAKLILRHVFHVGSMYVQSLDLDPSTPNKLRYLPVRLLGVVLTVFADHTNSDDHMCQLLKSAYMLMYAPEQRDETFRWLLWEDLFITVDFSFIKIAGMLFISGMRSSLLFILQEFQQLCEMLTEVNSEKLQSQMSRHMLSNCCDHLNRPTSITIKEVFEYFPLLTDKHWARMIHFNLPKFWYPSSVDPSNLPIKSWLLSKLLSLPTVELETYPYLETLAYHMKSTIHLHVRLLLKHTNITSDVILNLIVDHLG